MGISPTFGNGYVAKEVQEFQKRLEAATVFLLKYLGEKLAKYAKDLHSYTDRTGNLTNSIGYAVVKKNDIVFFAGPDNAGEGEQAALNVAMKMAQSLQHDYSLLIVAGMNYAAYVEAKGYSVIVPAELKCYSEFPKVMKQLMDKAEAKAIQMFGNIA